MISIGTVVKLRCGGPRMVVVGSTGTSLRCAWICRDSQVREVIVPQDALRKCWF